MNLYWNINPSPLELLFFFYIILDIPDSLVNTAPYITNNLKLNFLEKYVNHQSVPTHQNPQKPQHKSLEAFLIHYQATLVVSNSVSCSLPIYNFLLDFKSLSFMFDFLWSIISFLKFFLSFGKYINDCILLFQSRD